ncbi:hypothetical protein [Sporosarcina trichiuri]|uniref:hypothetical protein n=1 Tax=Sporosarcina trichiuri TaxID=3056445 RepID=UPI0025B4B96D|nr:hypothetical protein [Sporosarcina sp. 0.2-SM1T-5]WJY26414.1 hypothetical protein QWT68_10000 [Sporosarcina sp. 0.2-SM1T-5]
MGTIIFIILYLILVLMLLKDIEKGIISYVIFSLFAPNLNINNTQISFEISAFFIVIIILLIKRREIFTLYKKGKVFRQRLWMYFFLLIFSTLVGTIRYESSIGIVSIFGIFRTIIVIYLLQFIMKQNEDKVLDKIIWPILFINFITSVIQLTFPESTTFFYNLYYKESLTPLNEVLRLGYFSRAYGTFGSPVLLGVFSVFSFAVYFGYLIEKKKCKIIYIKLILSIAIGLMALSKTAILGLPALLIIFYFLALYGIIKVKNRKTLLIPILVFPMAIGIIKILERQGLFIYYYLEYLLKPFEVFETRYDSTEGILANTYMIIKENWFIGVGKISISDIFIGDSMYIDLIYTSGIIGLAVYFSILLSATLWNIRFRNTTAVFCVAALCLAGTGAPVQFEILSAILIAYVFSKAEKSISLNVKKHAED